MRRHRPDNLLQVFLVVPVWGGVIMVLYILGCVKLVILLHNEGTLLTVFINYFYLSLKRKRYNVSQGYLTNLE